MDYPALKDEIGTDPVSMGYSGKTPAQVLALLHDTEQGRTLPRGVVDIREVYEQFDVDEWEALHTAQNDWKFIALGLVTSMLQVDVQSAVLAGTIKQVFGTGSVTVQNLIAFRNRAVSRAEELGLGDVRLGDVEQVFAELGW